MGQAATERAAHADRIMRDIPHHQGQEVAQRPVADRLVEIGMACAGADAEHIAVEFNVIQSVDEVDVDQMAWPREPEGHGWHQALPAGQDSSVFRCVFCQQRDGFFHRPGSVIVK